MAQYRDRTFSKFDPTEPLTAQRQMTLHNVEVKRGDSVYDKVPDLSTEVCRRLWMTHHATYTKDYTPTAEQVTHGEGKEWMDEADGVSVVEGDNGWFTIQASWLGDGEKVRGAEAAETRATEVRSIGDTKGVSYAHTGGGWYSVTAPWLTEPEKVKGEDTAKARVAELIAGGKPETHLEEISATDALVLVSIEGEADDAEYVVNAPWLDAPERFVDPDAAEARQKALREAGPPEGWEPAVDGNTGE
jgi:hypothetical protein